MKYFCNELYGYVIIIGFNIVIFIVFWNEISVVFVVFGYDQVEIDRLKVECGGEEDYLNVLFEWVNSEEEVKL